VKLIQKIDLAKDFEGFLKFYGRDGEFQKNNKTLCLVFKKSNRQTLGR